MGNPGYVIQGMACVRSYLTYDNAPPWYITVFFGDSVALVGLCVCHTLCMVNNMMPGACPRRITLTVSASALLLGLNPRDDPFLMAVIASFSLGHLTKVSYDFFHVVIFMPFLQIYGFNCCFHL